MWRAPYPACSGSNCTVWLKRSHRRGQVGTCYDEGRVGLRKQRLFSPRRLEFSPTRRRTCGSYRSSSTLGSTAFGAGSGKPLAVSRTESRQWPIYVSRCALWKRIFQRGAGATQQTRDKDTRLGWDLGSAKTALVVVDATLENEYFPDNIFYYHDVKMTRMGRTEESMLLPYPPLPQAFVATMHHVPRR